MAEQKKKTGLIYTRVSSKEQVDNTSLESQEARCREFAEREGIQVLGVFIDKGESAKTADRPEFAKAIAFCSPKSRDVNYFIVYKLDRFSRNQDDFIGMRARLKQYGTELRSASEPINETPIGRMMQGVISSVAEFDNAYRTERTRGGMLERAKQGVWCWAAPLGYNRPTPHQNIAPDPKVAPLIALLFEEYTKGHHTFKSLAVFMGERGLATKAGKPPYAQLIEKILRNPIYCGRIEVFGDRFQGTFDSIISEDLFLQCQPGYKGSSGHSLPRRANNPIFPLRRLIVCSECHRPLTGSFSRGRKGKRYPYYHHHHQSCSEAAFLPKETFEESFIEYLKKITPGVKYERMFKEVVLDIWQANHKKIDERFNAAKRAVEGLQQERQKIFDLHRKGSYSDTDFLEQKKLIEIKLDQKHRLLQESRIDELDMEKVLTHCFNYVRHTARKWVEADPDEKARFQKVIFDDGNVTFDGKTFGTTKLSPVYGLAQSFDGKKSNLVAPPGFGPGLPA